MTQGTEPEASMGAANLHDDAGVPVAAPPAPPSGVFQGDVGANTLGEAWSSYIRRVRGGQPGALPALFGLIVLLVAFGATTKLFLTTGNLANIPGQAAPTIVIAMGLLFVLLLGEIDLSAGTAAGVCSGAMALAVNNHGDLEKALHGGTYGAYVATMIVAIAVAVWQRLWPATAMCLVGLVLLLTHLTNNQVLAILLAVTTGTAIGVLTGILVARVGIPSFVVTLALFLGWQGVLLLFEGQGAAVPTGNHNVIAGLEGTNVPPALGWTILAVSVALYAALTLTRSLKRRAQKLSAEPVALVLGRVAALTVVGVFGVYFLNQNRGHGKHRIEGMPWVIPIVLILLIALTLLLSRTAFGRHLYATGGNAEAARRAGIDVPRMRVAAFAISSTLAAFGGVILASYSGGVPSGAGGGNTLLFAVGAAVVGGTSLFGGRGRARDAVLGGLVIALIPNGLGLHANLNSAYTYVITGGFLLMAAAVDAGSRRRSAP